MGMKDLNKEVTRAMQDEFQNEKVKVDDEEAKITFNSLESDDQRENLLWLMKQQEIQKKKEKEEREHRKMEKMAKKIEEKDKNLSDFDDLSDELDVPYRYVCIKSEENGQFVWKMRKVPVYAAVDARQTMAWLDLMSALKSGQRQSRAELRRGRGMKWRGLWPYKEETEITHRKERKGTGKG
ncbi:uncharacterized protein MONOS_16184 [Monocercomonoides exilis]|uniref:uncharacterized protein n=1 Tax=Monocercomonoides exilis TaxID=2049356 RepID=UPI00355A31E1|nr:hypothetical protein MONOS_16184 [Monocercomonoides exilis]|eukprot:MONOS_16184.1-p1 / transcript=MONOS_16184.1 / gene=MONOS_16184 / organism=Monocercomonoides_exilis_PA203 / gene_product=unspecified product / transcript_product=unspecified product / location=Mono_scaffold01552:3681-4395(-) / protein_length=182 / sequence_SO=supercontig / SO=protein_coding / is_pseudo=false